MNWIDRIRFNKEGTIPAIIQDKETGKVLMLGWMNREAIAKTLATGKVHFWSRSRKKLWLKGESSGHLQLVREIYIDCDEDTLLFKVNQIKGACHKGYRSCFFREVTPEGEFKIKEEKVFNPEEVYK